MRLFHLPLRPLQTYDIFRIRMSFWGTPAAESVQSYSRLFRSREMRIWRSGVLSASDLHQSTGFQCTVFYSFLLTFALFAPRTSCTPTIFPRAFNLLPLHHWCSRAPEFPLLACIRLLPSSALLSVLITCTHTDIIHLLLIVANVELSGPRCCCSYCSWVQCHLVAYCHAHFRSQSNACSLSYFPHVTLWPATTESWLRSLAALRPCPVPFRIVSILPNLNPVNGQAACASTIASPYHFRKCPVDTVQRANLMRQSHTRRVGLFPVLNLRHSLFLGPWGHAGKRGLELQKAVVSSCYMRHLAGYRWGEKDDSFFHFDSISSHPLTLSWSAKRHISDSFLFTSPRHVRSVSNSHCHAAIWLPFCMPPRAIRSYRKWGRMWHHIVLDAASCTNKIELNIGV